MEKNHATKSFDVLHSMENFIEDFMETRPIRGVISKELGHPEIRQARAEKAF